MPDQPRARRLAGRIHQIVASALRAQVKDPRLGMVTVTDVQVTADLREATVFYTVLGDEAEQAASAAALASARGVLRTEVGRQTGVRHTPSLAFVPDVVPDTARHIDELVALARARDEQLRRAAADARPAGDEQPYRTPDGEPS